MALGELAAALGGRLAPPSAAATLASGLVVDSRLARAGSVFVALSGGRDDGHAHTDDAVGRGAVAVVVSRAQAAPSGVARIEVADGRLALRAFARHQLARFPVLVVGITGSAGKTSTKELTAAVLETTAPVLRNAGNLNTAVGLPMALFHLGPQHRWAVLEYGTSTPGELADLCSLVRPDVAVVTLVDWAHSANLGGLQGIAAEKEALVRALPIHGTAVLNADDDLVWAMAAHAPRSLLFGLGERAQVRGVELVESGLEGSDFTVLWPDGQARRAHLPLPGQHSVRNALAAVAVGWLLGVTADACVRGLAGAQTTSQRLHPRPGAGGALVLDDAYNANPASTRAALAVLAARSGRRVAVLGSMRELGEVAPEAHRLIGVLAGGCADRVIALGEFAREMVEAAASAGAPAEMAPDVSAALALLRDELRPGTTILVKGSRGEHLEDLVEALL